jgi:pimeloyl-ACP methyl ester carboxylesterase
MSGPADEPWEPGHGADDGYALFVKERRVVADDGTPIAYSYRNRDGHRVPVIFANGWSCSDVYWGGIAPRLEELGHPVLIPDTRGHGRSGLPRPPGRGARNLTADDVSMARVARDLVAVLDDADVERAMVVGHSMGTQVALEVYRQIPDRVAALVLVAGTYENPAKTFYGTGIGDATFPLLALTMRWAPELAKPLWATIGPKKLGHLGARLLGAAGPKATADDLHPYLLHLRSVDLPTMVLMAGAMRAHSAADLLGEIACPTLVVAAGADVFTPARCSEAMHHLIAGSELVTFPGTGHTLPIEEPEAVADAIDDFATRRLPAPRPAKATPKARATGRARGARARS